jgi:HEAT repeat protein
LPHIYLPDEQGINDTSFCAIDKNEAQNWRTTKICWFERREIFTTRARQGILAGYLCNIIQKTNPREGSLADNQLTLEIEQALTSMVKLMKALRFYPKGHPSLQTAIADCMSSFAPMLGRQHNRAIQVCQTGFSFGETIIGEKNPALPDLSRLLAERRVNQMIFLPDLPAEELLTLLEGLTTPAEEIYHLGGLSSFLNNHQIETIWLNESSLDGALQKRQQLAEEAEQAEVETEDDEEASSAPADKSNLDQQLREIIEQLKIEQHDDAYRLQIEKLLQLAPAYFEQSGAPGALRILPLLFNQSQQEEHNRTQRKIAAGALERLLTEEIISLLLEQLRKTSLTPQQFRRLQQFIISLGIRIAPQLLAMMSKEEDSSARKRLTNLLGQMGEPLLDLLREMTHSDKWYVVRNAVTLLGDLRLDAGVDILKGLTDHPDQRVRRTLIRSLAMIGGRESVAPLLKLTRDSATALRRPAVKALGATKSIEAVQPLLNICQSFDPFGHQSEIRSDAVAALGILGEKEAVAPLLTLARRPNLLRLKRLEALRAEIILALGKLGDKDLVDTFNQWRKSPHGIVQRAAELSLTTLMKKNDNTTTD